MTYAQRKYILDPVPDDDPSLSHALMMLLFWVDKKGVHDTLSRYFEGPGDFERRENVTLSPEIRKAWTDYLGSAAILLGLLRADADF